MYICAILTTGIRYLEDIFVEEITDLRIGAQDDPSLVTQYRILVKKFSVQERNKEKRTAGQIVFYPLLKKELVYVRTLKLKEYVNKLYSLTHPHYAHPHTITDHS
jgi:hypothetical protein